MSLLLPPGLDLVRGCGLLLEVTTETLMTGTSGLLGAPVGQSKADRERGGQGEGPCSDPSHGLGGVGFAGSQPACPSPCLAGTPTQQRVGPRGPKGLAVLSDGSWGLSQWTEVVLELGGSGGRDLPWERRGFQPGVQKGHGWEGAARGSGDGRPPPRSTWAEGSGPGFPPLLGGGGHLGHRRRGGLRPLVSTWKPSLFGREWRKAGVRVHASPWKQQ